MVVNPCQQSFAPGNHSIRFIADATRRKRLFAEEDSQIKNTLRHPALPHRLARWRVEFHETGAMESENRPINEIDESETQLTFSKGMRRGDLESRVLFGYLPSCQKLDKFIKTMNRIGARIPQQLRRIENEALEMQTDAARARQVRVSSIRWNECPEHRSSYCHFVYSYHTWQYLKDQARSLSNLLGTAPENSRRLQFE